MAENLGGVREFVKAVPFKDAVLIVGSGPSALNADKVLSYEPNHTVIAVNGGWKALKKHKLDVYMAFDVKAPVDWYWPREEQPATHSVIGWEIAPRYPWDYYTFHYTLSLQGLKRKPLQPPLLHGGGTITCCAMQLAMIYKNVKLINLIGCEMSKNEHFNKLLPETVPRKARGSVMSINDLVVRCRKMGIQVNHIGFSFVQCPRIDVHHFKEKKR